MASKRTTSGKKSKQPEPVNPSSNASILAEHHVNIYNFLKIEEMFAYFSRLSLYSLNNSYNNKFDKEFQDSILLVMPLLLTLLSLVVHLILMLVLSFILALIFILSPMSRTLPCAILNGNDIDITDMIYRTTIFLYCCSNLLCFPLSLFDFRVRFHYIS